MEDKRAQERMTAESAASSRIKGWEQHIGAAAQAVVLIVLIWTGNSLIGLREQVAVMQVKVTTLQDYVSNSAGNSRPRFEAEREAVRMQDDISKLSSRVERLESARQDK